MVKITKAGVTKAWKDFWADEPLTPPEKPKEPWEEDEIFCCLKDTPNGVLIRDPPTTKPKRDRPFDPYRDLPDGVYFYLMPTPGELAQKFRNRWMDYNINYFGEVPGNPQPPPAPRELRPLRRKSEKLPLPEDSESSDEDSPPKKSMDPWCCRRPPKPSRQSQNFRVRQDCKDSPSRRRRRSRSSSQGREQAAAAAAAASDKLFDKVVGKVESYDMVLDVEEVVSI